MGNRNPHLIVPIKESLGAVPPKGSINAGAKDLQQATTPHDHFAAKDLEALGNHLRSEVGSAKAGLAVHRRAKPDLEKRDAVLRDGLVQDDHSKVAAKVMGTLPAASAAKGQGKNLMIDATPVKGKKVGSPGRLKSVPPMPRRVGAPAVQRAPADLSNRDQNGLAILQDQNVMIIHQGNRGKAVSALMTDVVRVKVVRAGHLGNGPPTPRHVGAPAGGLAQAGLSSRGPIDSATHPEINEKTGGSGLAIVLIQESIVSPGHIARDRTGHLSRGQSDSVTNRVIAVKSVENDSMIAVPIVPIAIGIGIGKASVRKDAMIRSDASPVDRSYNRRHINIVRRNLAGKKRRRATARCGSTGLFPTAVCAHAVKRMN